MTGHKADTTIMRRRQRMTICDVAIVAVVTRIPVDHRRAIVLDMLRNHGGKNHSIRFSFLAPDRRTGEDRCRSGGPQPARPTSLRRTGVRDAREGRWPSDAVDWPIDRGVRSKWPAECAAMGKPTTTCSETRKYFAVVRRKLTMISKDVARVSDVRSLRPVFRQLCSFLSIEWVGWMHRHDLQEDVIDVGRYGDAKRLPY